MVIQVLGPLLPAGVCLAKMTRNASNVRSDDDNLEAKKARDQGIIDRLTTGGRGAPITYWSKQHLERMIKTNSTFKLHADYLRTCNKLDSS